MPKLRESAPKCGIAEAFVVRIAGAASMWPLWQGHVGSTGVQERSKGTGWIAWRPERSQSRPRNDEPENWGAG